MDLYVTLTAFAVGLALVVYSLRLEHKPRTSFDAPLLKPAHYLMVGILIMLIAGAHLLTLLFGKR